MHALRRPLIWIVDDSRTGATITQRALGSHHDYETFSDGVALIERLKATARFPDVVLLDWVMPGMTGDEVCRFVRADPQMRSLSIIMLTASRIETRDIVHALESGANDYVAKPFVAEELRARVAAVLREGHLKREAERERERITTINRLGRALFEAGPNVDAILHAMAHALVGRLCDGCAVMFFPSSVAEIAVAHHKVATGAAILGAIASITDPMIGTFDSATEALASLPSQYGDYIRAHGLRGIAVRAISARALAQGVVTLTRDGDSLPFDAQDLAAIEACLDHTGLALEAAIRSEAERATMRFHEELIGIVSHDLRTPLAALAMGVEMLGRPGATPSEQLLARLDNSTRRMTTIVDQLLDVTRTRLDTGIPIAPRPTQLLPLIHNVLEELKLGRAASFDVTGDDVTGLWDGDRLAQVISNLASNAVQYGRPDTPIRVAVASDASHARITISNAIREQPIPPEELATLFDPFKRADTGRRHSGGLGLGLYIVAEIVRAHHGTIGVESRAGTTIFRVTLPIAPA